MAKRRTRRTRRTVRKTVRRNAPLTKTEKRVLRGILRKHTR